MKTACPHCQEPVDSHTSVSHPGVEIKPGDYSLCAFCSGLVVVGTDSHLRKPTVAEVMDLKRDTEGWKNVERARDIINKANALKKP